MQQNLKVLSERNANDSFKKIRDVNNLVNMGADEKMPKIAKVLERIFNEVTSTDFINVNYWQDKTLGKRMFHVFKNDRNISSYLIDLTDRTRETYNNFKHKEYVPNDKDYLIAVEATSLCIEYFSGVEIPLEIQSIYSPKIVVTPPPVVVQPEPPKTKDIAVSVPSTIKQEDLINNPEPIRRSTKPNFISKILIALVILVILLLGYKYFTNNSPKNKMEVAIALLEQSKYDSAMVLYKKLIENNFEPSNSQIILFENGVINHYDNLKTPGGGKMFTPYKFAQRMLKIYIPSSGKISYVNRFGVKMKRDFDGGDDFGQDKSQKDYAKVFKINNVNPKTKKPFGNFFYIDTLGVCRVSCEIDK